MTVTSSSHTQPAGTRASGGRFSSRQLLVGAIVISAVLSALSLVFNHAIDYDPEGWIVYAREVFGPLTLNTDGFPAWKPLPVILVGPFTLLTRGEADVYYWLFITRAASVLTVFAVAALAYRFGGRWAALLAGLMVVLSPWWGEDGAVGRDSSLSALGFVCAYLAHYRGWYRSAVVALVVVALLRPEATPLLFLYGLWMWRSRRLGWWYPLGGILIIAFMWLVPTIFHTGLSPASISLNTGGSNTASKTSFPALTVIVYAAKQAHEIAAILVVVAGLAVLYRLVLRRNDFIANLWGRSQEELLVLAGAIAWVLIVAVETQKGYAGNPRYLVPAVALFFAVASVAAVRLAGASRLALAASLAVCTLGIVAFAVHPLRSGVQFIQKRDSQVYDIRQELAVVNCPGYIESNPANNAYVAQITGEPLQDSVNWHLPNVWLDRGSYYWLLYCKR